VNFCIAADIVLANDRELEAENVGAEAWSVLFVALLCEAENAADDPAIPFAMVRLVDGENADIDESSERPADRAVEAAKEAHEATRPFAEARAIEMPKALRTDPSDFAAVFETDPEKSAELPERYFFV
jgi:hypothetical protein